ncbi:MAG TPA: hypothetical protein VGD10_00935 [Allosphingosinicella sp.]|uniref:hypothetical protein n=1 Tax=Allosphingosinicella sp. TaxID=2823234 RepID=UPI002ED7A9F5
MIGSKASLAAFLLLSAQAAAGQTAGKTEAAPSGAAGMDLFLSGDADQTGVVRLGLNLDWRYEAPDRYQGVRIEKAWFDPFGQGRRERERVYLRGADRSGDWNWNGRIGTDGDTVLGAAAIHNNAPVRQEYFIEREIVETPQGLKRGIYYTFAGAAVDLPVDDRNTFTLLGGVQEFSGDNVRTHLRANYVHVIEPEWGLSGQIRTRLFRNSDPREFDYYSPRWYAQILPVLQLRRQVEGWRYLVAAGIGTQRDSEQDWRRSSYFNTQFTSPARGKWAFNASFLYSETPTTSGLAYNYKQFTIGLTRVF